MATATAQSPSRPATGMDAAKKTLRRQVGAAVRALDAAAVAEQSERIAANIRALPEFANARALSVYLHMPAGEAQTTQLLAAAFGAGKKVYVPKIMGRTPDDLKMVHALSPADVAAFPKDKWLIPDPPLATPDDVPRDDPILEQDLELVLLPGVAFDRRGGRLGHGKAYYDCFLRRLAEFYQDYHRPMPTLVGICLTPQLIEDVPVDEHDHTLDIIVTPDEVIRVLST